MTAKTASRGCFLAKAKKKLRGERDNFYVRHSIDKGVARVIFYSQKKEVIMNKMRFDVSCVKEELKKKGVVFTVRGLFIRRY